MKARRVAAVVIALCVLAALAGAGGRWRIPLGWLRGGPSYDPVEGKSVLGAWRPPWPTPPAASGGAVPGRWIVVGWDGASWDLALPLLEAGKLPNLAALMREGAYGDMRSFKPTWSPVLWTSVATGVDPGKHGILAWGRVDRATGQTRKLFTNSDRRVRSIWNLMTEAGRPSLIVGYHNTFPADRVQGLMVSNYLYQEHLEDTLDAHDPAGNARAGLVYPPDRLREVVTIQHEVAASLPSAVPRFAAFGPDEAAAFEAPLGRALRPEDDRRKYFLKKAYLFDEFDGRVALAEYGSVKPDLAMVHFQCIDLAGHYFLYFHEPEKFRSMSWTPEQRARLDREARNYRGTVEAFYRFADDWLGKLAALRDPETGILLLSDHGFEPEPDPERTGYHVSAPPGIFVVAGPGVRPGFRPEGSTLYDVMPTLAATLGLPVAKDLRGMAMASWFSPSAWAGVHVKTVPTYEIGGRYVPDIPSPDDTERELIQQLKAIGYID